MYEREQVGLKEDLLEFEAYASRMKIHFQASALVIVEYLLSNRIECSDTTTMTRIITRS